MIGAGAPHRPFMTPSWSVILPVFYHVGAALFDPQRGSWAIA